RDQAHAAGGVHREEERLEPHRRRSEAIRAQERAAVPASAAGAFRRRHAHQHRRQGRPARPRARSQKVERSGMTREEAQALVDGGPYARWLGIKVLVFEEKGVEVKATWREDWIANPTLQQTHGGILAALIDF